MSPTHHRRPAAGAVAVLAVLTALPLGSVPDAAADDRGTRSERQLQRDVEAIHAVGVTGVHAEAQTSRVRSVARAGVADIRSGRPVPRGATFRGGSTVKTYIAAVVLQLVDEGRLRLDDTVEHWLPGVVHGNGNDGTRITVRNLLQHTSGLYDYVADVLPGSPEEYRAQRFDRYTPQDVVSIALRHRPDFRPGDTNPDGSAKWSYSNTGYALLGMIIEEATAKGWDWHVRHRIIEPLGLHDTTIPRHRPTLPGRYLRGYEQFAEGGALTDVTVMDTSVAGAAGSLVTTNADTNRFFRALMSGRVVPEPLLSRMQRTVPTGWDGPFEGTRYGLGIFWFPLPCDESGYWAHGGSFLGYTTRHGVSPDGDRAVAIAMSTQLYGRQAERQEAAAASAIENALCSNAGSRPAP